MFLGGGGGGWWVEGGGGAFRDEPEPQPAWPRLLCQAASRTNACGPVNTEQTYRHRGTGGNTATETRRIRGLCTASHLCLEIGPIGPMGGIWIRGESGPGGLSVSCGATTQTYAHGSVLVVAARGGGCIWCLHIN